MPSADNRHTGPSAQMHGSWHHQPGGDGGGRSRGFSSCSASPVGSTVRWAGAAAPLSCSGNHLFSEKKSSTFVQGEQHSTRCTGHLNPGRPQPPWLPAPRGHVCGHQRPVHPPLGAGAPPLHPRQRLAHGDTFCRVKPLLN